MTSTTLKPSNLAQAVNRRALSLELVLVVALPLIAVAFSSTAAYIAFVKGFTALPETAVTTPHH